MDMYRYERGFGCLWATNPTPPARPPSRHTPCARRRSHYRRRRRRRRNRRRERDDVLGRARRRPRARPQRPVRRLAEHGDAQLLALHARASVRAGVGRRRRAWRHGHAQLRVALQALAALAAPAHVGRRAGAVGAVSDGAGASDGGRGVEPRADAAALRARHDAAAARRRRAAQLHGRRAGRTGRAAAGAAVGLRAGLSQERHDVAAHVHGRHVLAVARGLRRRRPRAQREHVRPALSRDGALGQPAGARPAAPGFGQGDLLLWRLPAGPLPFRPPHAARPRPRPARRAAAVAVAHALPQGQLRASGAADARAAARERVHAAAGAVQAGLQAVGARVRPPELLSRGARPPRDEQPRLLVGGGAGLRAARAQHLALRRLDAAVGARRRGASLRRERLHAQLPVRPGGAAAAARLVAPPRAAALHRPHARADGARQRHSTRDAPIPARPCSARH